jgi:haloalkane dehalogenase
MSQPISADFPFTLKSVEVHGARMTYVDEGRGDPIVFLHGNPASSYLWRNIIPYLTGLGRCIAPDLIGMGRSDKPELAYRFVDHARHVDSFLRALDLDRITFVLHDWGSALGFDWAMSHEGKVRGLAFMEAILGPMPSWDRFRPEGRETFQALRTPGVGERMVLEENFFVEQILPKGVLRALTDAEMAYYRAPFAQAAARRPTLAWPREIPIAGQPADVVAISEHYREALTRSTLPKLLFTAEPGILVTAPVVAWAREHLPNLEIVSIGPGLHFVQEDHPHEIGAQLAAWVRRLKSPAGAAGPASAAATTKERTIHDVLGHDLADPHHGRDRPARRYGCSSRTTTARSGPLGPGAGASIGRAHRAAPGPRRRDHGGRPARPGEPGSGPGGRRIGLLHVSGQRRHRTGRRELRRSRPAGRRTAAGRRDVRGSFSPREPEPPRSRTVARRRGAGLGRSGSHHPADRVAILRERAHVARPIDP